VDRAERDAFEAFVAASGPRLLRTALFFTGDRGHAEDLLQITLERIARRWSRLEGSPEAYARVVMADHALLGITVGTVKSTGHRGLEKLRVLFPELDDARPENVAKEPS
jgi:DNA-directed RNA polymerase specialized sigma24 family protein